MLTRKVKKLHKEHDVKSIKDDRNIEEQPFDDSFMTFSENDDVNLHQNILLRNTQINQE